MKLILTIIVNILFLNTFFCQKNVTDSAGLKQGKWTSFYEEGGSLKNEMNYINDTLQGEGRTYYLNGALRSIITYNKGVKIKQSSFYEDGKKQLFTLYDSNGNIKYSCKYDENGVIRMQNMYFSDPNGKTCEYTIHKINDTHFKEGGGSWK